MTFAPYFHVGVLVPDLVGAIERFGDVLGVRFADPVRQDTEYFEQDGRMNSLELHLTYSIDGPPYYELIEAQGEGLYGLKHGEGIHHVGVWEADCEQKRQELEAKGLKREGALYRPDGSIIVAFFEPAALGGVRLEIADLALKEGHEAWLAGGRFVR